jgi:hypothetical protein
MPREARLDAPGALHRIVVRGIERRKIFCFQTRYMSILCQEKAYLLEFVRYIRLNPFGCRITSGTTATAASKGASE